MTARRCICGQPVPKGRKRHCSDGCARVAWKAAEKAKAAATAGPKAVAVPGAEHGGLVFLPDHVLARRNGWVSAKRLRAYDECGGVARCAATGRPLEWPEANVLDLGADLMVLCKAHTRVRSFGQWLADSGFGGLDGSDIALRLAALWSTPCLAAGVASDSEEERAGPIPLNNKLLGGSGHPGPPVSQGRL